MCDVGSRDRIGVVHELFLDDLRFLNLELSVEVAQDVIGEKYSLLAFVTELFDSQMWREQREQRERQVRVVY